VGSGAVPGGADGWAVGLKRCLEQIGPPPSSGLGFLYLTGSLAVHAGSIAMLVRRLTGLPDWIGAASDTILAVGPAGPQVLPDADGGEPGIAMMILSFPDDAVRLVRLPDHSPSGRGLDALTYEWMGRAAPVSAFIHADPRNGEAIKATLALGAREQLLSTGALLASTGGMPQLCGTALEGGATGALYCRAAAGVVGVAQGCLPIGPTRRITAMSGSIIETLDGVSARAAFQRDIGDLLARDPARTRGYVFAGLHRTHHGGAKRPIPTSYPSPVFEPEDYAVTTILDPDGTGTGLRLSADAKIGDALSFVRHDQTGAIEALDRMVDRLVRSVGRSRIRGAHLTTSGCRVSSLFGDPMVELRRVSERLGPIPMIGFHVEAPIVADMLYSRSALLTLWAEFSDDS
jgi:hypothetical protein